MSNEGPKEADQELERELREGRKFTPEEALARLAGPGAMKGASTVSRQRQAENEIGCWLRDRVTDPAGALRAVVHRKLKGSQLLLNNLDRPLTAVAGLCEALLRSELLLKDLVREVDMEWGRMMDERPYFERAESPQHPDDPYTVETVRRTLGEMLRRLNS